MKNSGYIPLWRKLRDNFLWAERRKFSKAEAWIDILFSAQHSETPREVVLGMKVLLCYYAQTLTSTKSWAERWGWSQTTVRRFFKMLAERNMVEVKNEGKTTRLTVCNYGKYDIRRRATGEDPAGSRRAAGGQPVTDNNDNNVKNEKKVKQPGRDKSSFKSFQQMDCERAEQSLAGAAKVLSKANGPGLSALPPPG